MQLNVKTSLMYVLKVQFCDDTNFRSFSILYDLFLFLIYLLKNVK